MGGTGYSVSGVLSGDLGSIQYGTVPPPTLSFPCQQIQSDTWFVLSAVTSFSPDVHLVTATITGCYGFVGTWTINLAINAQPPLPPTPTPCSLSSVSLIDPVASGLLSGSGVTQNAGAIAAATNPTYVSGAAADGVTQVIVRIPTGQAGDIVQLTLLNENGQQDTVANNGGLFPLNGSPASASSTVSVLAQGTSSPTAYAVWRAPANYYRGTQDATTVERNLTLQAQCTSAGGSPTTVSQTISTTRPPVLLVHGLWSSPDAWKNFSPTNQSYLSMWNILFQKRADYNLGVPGVTATSPSYLWTPAVNENALGFAYNAPTVLSYTQKLLGDFERSYNVAAVQADVVAHSMGGDIARVMPTLTGFYSQGNYGLGPVHKLITIGTPHQGTPLAVDLLPNNGGDPSWCVRGALGLFAGMPSFQTVTIGTNPAVNGAVGDLAAASANLPPGEPFPMAYLAGSTTQDNLTSVGQTARGISLGACADFGDPLALDLTPTMWNSVFSGAANDGVVPLNSQLNGVPSNPNPITGNTYTGSIHTSALTALGFVVPSELDPASGIPDAVVGLLNEATNGSDFH